MIYGLTAACAVLVAAVAARLIWRPAATQRALATSDPTRFEWRLSCLLSGFIAPTALIILVMLVVGAALEGPLTTDRWAVSLAIVISVIANHAYYELTKSRAAYWRQCHDSLRAALPVFVNHEHIPHDKNEYDCQALKFNEWHTSILEPMTRKHTLKEIFNASPHPPGDAP